MTCICHYNFDNCKYKPFINDISELKNKTYDGPNFLYVLESDFDFDDFLGRQFIKETYYCGYDLLSITLVCGIHNKLLSLFFKKYVFFPDLYEIDDDTPLKGRKIYISFANYDSKIYAFIPDCLFECKAVCLDINK